MAKELVEVNGRQVRMSETAFAIASKHFGATKKRAISKEIPIELRKVAPKLDITPAKPAPISEPIKSQVDLTAKEVNVTAVPDQEKIPEAKTPEAKTVTRRKPVRR
jgi:hypothetical protein